MVVLKSARRHLHYEDVGAGRLILLVHGFTNYGLSWAPQLAALVHSGYRVIIPDLYGHGASSPATALSTVSDLAADMVGLLDHLVPGQSCLRSFTRRDGFIADGHRPAKPRGEYHSC
jgi:pimeloyl-ACP methyl ester carboxylesterase